MVTHVSDLQTCETGEEYFVSFRSYGGQVIFGSSALCLQMRELMYYYQSVRRTIQGKIHLDPRVRIRAYCIMPDEYALLIKQEISGGIEAFCNSINEAIGAYYGALFNITRRVFQDDPVVTLISHEAELLSAIRYINLMPAQGDIVRDGNMHDYPWCSMVEYGHAIEHPVVDRELSKEYFRDAYHFMRFIESGKV
jgi:hypothetical protein